MTSPDSVDGLTGAIRELAQSNGKLARRLPARWQIRIAAIILVLSGVAAGASASLEYQIKTGHTDSHQILKIIQREVSPAATEANNAEVKTLRDCVYNRIDFDTGHAKGLLPGC